MTSEERIYIEDQLQKRTIYQYDTDELEKTSIPNIRIYTNKRNEKVLVPAPGSEKYLNNVPLWKHFILSSQSIPRGRWLYKKSPNGTIFVNGIVFGDGWDTVYFLKKESPNPVFVKYMDASLKEFYETYTEIVQITFYENDLYVWGLVPTNNTSMIFRFDKQKMRYIQVSGSIDSNWNNQYMNGAKQNYSNRFLIHNNYIYICGGYYYYGRIALNKNGSTAGITTLISSSQIQKFSGSQTNGASIVLLKDSVYYMTWGNIFKTTTAGTTHLKLVKDYNNSNQLTNYWGFSAYDNEKGIAVLTSDNSDSPVAIMKNEEIYWLINLPPAANGACMAIGSWIENEYIYIPVMDSYIRYSIYRIPITSLTTFELVGNNDSLYPMPFSSLHYAEPSNGVSYIQTTTNHYRNNTEYNAYIYNIELSPTNRVYLSKYSKQTGVAPTKTRINVPLKDNGDSYYNTTYYRGFVHGKYMYMFYVSSKNFSNGSFDPYTAFKIDLQSNAVTDITSLVSYLYTQRDEGSAKNLYNFGFLIIKPETGNYIYFIQSALGYVNNTASLYYFMYTYNINDNYIGLANTYTINSVSGSSYSNYNLYVYIWFSLQNKLILSYEMGTSMPYIASTVTQIADYVRTNMRHYTDVSRYNQSAYSMVFNDFAFVKNISDNNYHLYYNGTFYSSNRTITISTETGAFAQCPYYSNIFLPGNRTKKIYINHDDSDYYDSITESEITYEDIEDASLPVTVTNTLKEDRVKIKPNINNQDFSERPVFTIVAQYFDDVLI